MPWHPWHPPGSAPARFASQTIRDDIYSARSKPSARLERWVLRLQPYEFKVVYQPGPQNIADPLSRLLPHGVSKSEQNETEDYVRFVATMSTPRALSTREIERASAADKELSDLRMCIQSSDTPVWDKRYLPVMEERCVIGHLVLRGTRIIISQSLRPRLLALAHGGHLGIVNTKPKISELKCGGPAWNVMLRNIAERAMGCQIVSHADPPEPIRSTPLSPWSVAGFGC